jgi:hypothetical protein
MTKPKVRLTKEQVVRYQAAEVFWESRAAWNKCANDDGKKAALIAGYVVGWERNARPPLPYENVVTVVFEKKPGSSVERFNAFLSRVA